MNDSDEILLPNIPTISEEDGFTPCVSGSDGDRIIGMRVICHQLCLERHIVFPVIIDTNTWGRLPTSQIGISTFVVIPEGAINTPFFL